MEIQPATIEQVAKGRDGKMITIDADVGGIAQQLTEVDPHLKLRFSESGGYFVVYREAPEGSELVGTYQELDHRVLKDVQRLAWLNRQPGYSYADELDKKDAEADKEAEHARKEAMGEPAEKLHYALRKDKNMLGQRAFIKKDIKE